MQTFKTKAFARFAKRDGLEDAALCEAVRRARDGLVDADLGGGVIKQRIARGGGGRFRRIPHDCAVSPGAGWRFSSTDSPRATGRTCGGDELTAFRLLADEYLALDSAGLSRGAGGWGDNRGEMR